MKNLKDTIRKTVGYLNNPDQSGGFWLPNIQRPFVWSEDQICRLFDSILREYPISTLLVWKTKSSIRRRKFIDNWKPTLKLSDFYVPEDDKPKSLVLDGQQRLQSLFIGLRGSFEGRELQFDILSGEVAAPDDIKYRFKFLDKSATDYPWVLFKELVFTTKNNRQMRDVIVGDRQISATELDKIEDHLTLVDRTFKMDDAIAFQELDSIDNSDLYREDDVVEIFIRANSGGTRLGKSDLLFSLLSANWDEADASMEELLDSLNKFGFKFDRDFVLKTCLAILGQGARYDVAKFRKPGVRESISNEWDHITEAIQDVLDFVRGKTYIQCDKALPSYLVLIPLIYLRFRYEEVWKSAKDIDNYLLRTLLTQAFGGQPDNLIDALLRAIDEKRSFDLSEMFNVVRSQGRSLDLTEDRLLQLGYGSDSIHLLFNIWYRQFNHTPSYSNNLPEIDHIFPQSALKEIKITSTETNRKVMKYKEVDRNQLANCMLLTKDENGAGGKGAILPENWFVNKSIDYLNMHLIPLDRELWRIDNYEKFIEARKILIKDKFKDLLVPSRALSLSDLLPDLLKRRV